jgi:hypothetical protein
MSTGDEQQKSEPLQRDTDKLMARVAQALQQKLGKYSPDEKLAGIRKGLGSSYGLNYFQQLRTEWSLIDDDAKQKIGPSGQQRLTELLSKSADDLTWSDLYAFERFVTRAVPLKRLERLGLWIRDQYKDIVGADGYQAYEKGQFPPADGSDEESLRTDLEELQCQVQWHYIMLPLEESSRNHLSKWLSKVMFVLAALLLIWIPISYYFVTQHDPAPQPIAFVLFAGALGATFSAQRRIQTTGGRPGTLLSLMRSDSTRLSVQIAPIIGGLSAMILAFLFASGLLSGALFPKVAISDTPPDTLPLFLPLDSAHDGPFAMLMIWSFVAGFAERLVPDTLDRLAAQADKQKFSGGTP